MSEVPVPAATSPPLSATPSGVTSDQRLAPAGRTNSCQKLLSEAADPPMTAIAQVPCAVTSDVLSGTVTVGGAGLVTAARCDPQAATRPAQDTARPTRTPWIARDPLARPLGQSADHERPSA